MSDVGTRPSDATDEPSALRSIFGVEPPPEPAVVQQPAQAPARTATAGPVLDERDPQPWRRRGVTFLTFLATTAFLLAHVGGWVDLRALDAGRSAPAAAGASVDRAREDAAVYGATNLQGQLLQIYRANNVASPATLPDDSYEATLVALQDPRFGDAWESVLEQALDREAAAIRDDAAPAGTAPVLDLQPFTASARDQLVARGYDFLAGREDLSLGTYPLPETDTADLPRTVVRVLASTWWSWLALAVVLGAVAVAAAHRRVRLIGLLAADVALVLILALLLVLLFRPLAGDVVTDPSQEALALDVYDGLTRSLVVGTLVVQAVCVLVLVACLVVAGQQRRRARRRVAAAADVG